MIHARLLQYLGFQRELRCRGVVFMSSESSENWREDMAAALGALYTVDMMSSDNQLCFKPYLSYLTCR